MGSRKEYLEAIEKAIGEGATTAREISGRTEIPLSTIYLYHERGDVRVPDIRLRSPRRETFPLVMQACESTVSETEAIENLRKVAKDTGHSLGNLVNYATREGLLKCSFSSNFRYLMNSDADILVKSGAKIKEIGRVVSKRAKEKCLAEIGRQYVAATGQHSIWKEASKGRREKRRWVSIEKEETGDRIFSELASTLACVVRKKAEQEGWAYEKTVEYLQGYKNSSDKNHSFDTLFRIFSNYENALKDGNKPNLEELAEGTEVHWASISKILRKVELPTMIKSYRKSRVLPTQQQVEEINRSFATPFSLNDLGYFIGVPLGVVLQRLKKLGSREFVKNFVIQQKGNEKICYRDASLIYEFQDEGYDVSEISELMEKSPKAIERTIQLRSKVEPEIISALRIIKQMPKLDKPYLDGQI